MRSFRVAVLSLLTIPPLLAQGLSSKYKSWDKSPEAYFLTSEERSRWKDVKDDAQAQAFIDGYFARRGPELPGLLRERIAVADKYFAAGTVRGSETLRGKVIILCGPPSKLEESGGHASIGRVSGDRGDIQYTSAIGSDPLTNVGPGGAGLTVSAKEPIFSIIYDEQAAPKAIAQAFRVDLKMKSAAKQEAVDPKDLEEKFELVAKASLRQ